MMDLDVSILTSIFAFCATLATAISTFLLYQQTRYKHKVHFISSISTYLIELRGNPIREIWWSPPSQENLKINEVSDDYRIKVQNIGGGPAYNVRYQQVFDFEHYYVKLIDKIGTEHPSFLITADEWGYCIELDGDQIGGFRKSSDTIGVIDFFGVGGSDNSVHLIPIDPSLSYIALCYCYAILSDVRNGGKGEKIIINFDLIIDCVDSAAYNKKFIIPLSLEISMKRYKDNFSGAIFSINLK